MTILEKKRAIIEKVENATSEEFISLLYYNMNNETKWDETEEGKNLIDKLLEKSQQDVREGRVHSFDEVKSKLMERFESRKAVSK